MPSSAPTHYVPNILASDAAQLRQLYRLIAGLRVRCKGFETFCQRRLFPQPLWFQYVQHEHLGQFLSKYCHSSRLSAVFTDIFFIYKSKLKREAEPMVALKSNILPSQLHSSSDSLSSAALYSLEKADPGTSRRAYGLSNSTSLPASRTATLSKSMIVSSLCATAMMVWFANRLRMRRCIVSSVFTSMLR